MPQIEKSEGKVFLLILLVRIFHPWRFKTEPTIRELAQSTPNKRIIINNNPGQEDVPRIGDQLFMKDLTQILALKPP